MNITRPDFGEEEIALLRDCLDSGWVTQGPFVARFETEFAEIQSLRHNFAVSSCTAALHIACAALELGPGDEMIVPAFTWVTSATAAEYLGARAVFVDVDPGSFNIDVTKIEQAITPRTRAIMAVHLFGLSADLDALRDIADRHGIYLIEDAACAAGTTYKGRPVGSDGIASCFSFHPRKVITTGEGGSIATTESSIAERIQSLRNHGAAGPPPDEADNPRPWTMARFPGLGFNYRMSDIQAAVGCAQLGKLERLIHERRTLAAHYSALLSATSDVSLPGDPDSTGGHTFQSFVIRVSDGLRDTRDRLMLAFEQAQIQTRPGTHAVHKLEYFSDKYQLSADAYPNAVLCENTSITLPLFPGMTNDDQQQVVAVIHDFFGNESSRI